jgi:hypothetical protein
MLLVHFRPGGVFAATADTQLRNTSQAELEALRQLTPQDWANLKLNQANLQVGETLYLNGLQRLLVSAGGTANHLLRSAQLPVPLC